MSQVSIGYIVTQAILQNSSMKNSEILNLVKEQLPATAKTSVACVAWYRNKIKKDNIQLQVQEVRTSATVAKEIEMLQEELQMLQEQEKLQAVASQEQIVAEIARLQAMLQQ